ncbi:MAG: T9SS type A sorting domain-containing protein [Flavobacteriales bacterium]|nr:T9SS type A sorting domain-containing protein [Flavobacteriales bacterium]
MLKIYSSIAVVAALLVGSNAMAQNNKALGPDANGFQTVHPVTPFPDGADRGGAPANDLCSGAVNQNLPASGSITFNGNNTGATDTEGIGVASTWERFTTTAACSRVVVNYCGTTPAFGNFFIVITQGCPFTSVVQNSVYGDCGDGNISLVYNELPAGTYYIPVLSEPASEGPYTITVTSSPCAPPATNNECAQAVTLTSNSFCLSTFGTNAQTTESLPAADCAGTAAGTANDDVWYKFTATQTSHTVAATGWGAFDVVLEAFSGSCSALVSIGCADATLDGETEVLELTGLTVGTTYYVRVFHWYASAPDDNNFQICVVNGTGVDVGVNDLNSTGMDWSIFPNPGQGDFNLAYNGSEPNVTIEVVDVAGRAVFSSQRVIVAGQTVPMNLNGVAPGLYTVRLTAAGISTEQRLMVR